MQQFEFANRLKQARKAHKMTQVHLSELLSVDRRVYNRWERGASVPQLNSVIKIAQVLQTSVDMLLGITSPGSSPIPNSPAQTLAARMDLLSHKEQQALLVLMESLANRTTTT